MNDVKFLFATIVGMFKDVITVRGVIASVALIAAKLLIVKFAHQDVRGLDAFISLVIL